MDGSSSNFIYDNDDELTGIRGTIVADIGYNANGEQTYTNVGGTPATFAYDYEGQLTGITKAGATTSFTYDALGRRMSRAAGGVTTAFQFAGSQVLTEKQGASTTGTYTWGSGLTRRNGEYPLMDGLGSEKRHRQLLDICERNGLDDLSKQALLATRRRLAQEQEQGVLEKPGAYYQKILIGLLEDHQVFVPPAGSKDEQAEVKRLARESLQQGAASPS